MPCDTHRKGAHADMRPVCHTERHEIALRLSSSVPALPPFLFRCLASRRLHPGEQAHYHRTSPPVGFLLLLPYPPPLFPPQVFPAQWPFYSSLWFPCRRHKHISGATRSHA
ncbi:hypothetical protein Naga_102042g1 [Nannochloropsis gaditana]|uniref:Uncharacterized protein n=1 Tax=Nannochloropsis gaditana TaxID=72520 RepID=W7TS64_9STRA|nr:hypothetical protein Naga_102042g1 [Nannochloropsis gaditana]